jgi:NTP pyrophosphatase (non-canonical NTP hydrolase)
MTPEELMQKAITTWGKDSQLDMVIEECAELIHAIQKYRRKRVTSAAIIEEAVDVELCLGQLKLIFNEVTDSINYTVFREDKLARLEKLLEGKMCNQVDFEQRTPIAVKVNEKPIAKTAGGEFNNVVLTTEEFKKLADKFGYTACQEKIESLSSYMASKGKKYKSHYATLLVWSRKEKTNPLPNIPGGRNNADPDKFTRGRYGHMVQQ